MNEPSETHDASNCDAFPLAVGLAQVQARYERLEALADKLAEALGEVLIGGNHLALLIGADHPPYTATTGEALTHYGAGDAYEVWCCWRSIMHAREALAAHTLHKIG